MDLDTLLNLARAYPGVALAWTGLAGLTLYFVIVWLLVGRDPKPDVLVPIFRPPDDMAAAEMHYLREKTCDAKTLASALAGLAAKGCASIQNRSDGTYGVSFKRGTAELAASERAVLDAAGGLFLPIASTNWQTIRKLTNALEDSLKASALRKAFTLNLPYSLTGLAALTALLIAIPIVSPNPLNTAATGAIVLTAWSFFMLIVPLDLWLKGKSLWDHHQRIVATAALGAAPLFLLPLLFNRPLFEIVSGVSALTTLAVLIMLCVTAQFAGFLFAPTRAGQDLLRRIEGFRHYIVTTELSQLAFHYPAEETPEAFDPLLAYAVALDCDLPWAKRFAAMVDFASHAPA